jgi:hypothetical protein
VGDRSRGRFPSTRCSPYSQVHVRRERVGFVHRSRAISCRPVPTITPRFATLSSLHTPTVAHSLAHTVRRRPGARAALRPGHEPAPVPAAGRQVESRRGRVRDRAASTLPRDAGRAVDHVLQGSVRSAHSLLPLNSCVSWLNHWDARVDREQWRAVATARLVDVMRSARCRQRAGVQGDDDTRQPVRALHCRVV